MRLEKVPFAETRSFSSFFLDYTLQKNSLRPFYSRFPVLKNFKEQRDEKSSFPKHHRDILVNALQKQYKNVRSTDAVKKNIAALSSERTFTVTTGHQLNIFTGPLYFIYKIITVINTCKQLQQAYPDDQFVPVYWMASEDHDFAEISYFYLYGKKYTWQTDQQGAVGRFDPKSLEGLLKEIPGDTSIFQEAYLRHDTLRDAVRYYVNELFGASGLIALDADDRSLKSLFKTAIRDDLFNHTAKRWVEKSSSALEAQGYTPPVHARETNLFYLDSELRSRIETTQEGFSVVDSPLHFSKEQLEKMIEEEPEKFSPNVILRPLYQELILPNLAYVGGPAEVAYWLQLKGLFDHYKVPFPILVPRNFALILDAPTRRKLEKTGLQIKDFFEEKNFLFNHWILKNTRHDLTLSQSINDVLAIFDQVKIKAEKIDQTLGPLVSAQARHVVNRLEKIEAKFIRAEKRLHADKMRQIATIKDALFPQGGLQERMDNFLNFYQPDPDFIQKLISNFDPFDLRFNILSYDEG
jgi:bacillithiol biosynthesis cysteine-adding enzyme BshC